MLLPPQLCTPTGIKISMVGIDKVKVRFPYFALAHVSHFFRTRAVGLQAIDAFFRFSLLKFYSCQLCFCICLPASLFWTHFQHFLHFSVRSLCTFMRVRKPSSTRIWMSRRLASEVRSHISPHSKSRKCFRLGPPRPYFVCEAGRFGRQFYDFEKCNFSQTTFVVGFVN